MSCKSAFGPEFDSHVLRFYYLILNYAQFKFLFLSFNFINLLTRMNLLVQWLSFCKLFGPMFDPLCKQNEVIFRGVSSGICIWFGGYLWGVGKCYLILDFIFQILSKIFQKNSAPVSICPKLFFTLFFLPFSFCSCSSFLYLLLFLETLFLYSIISPALHFIVPLFYRPILCKYSVMSCYKKL